MVKAASLVDKAADCASLARDESSGPTSEHSARKARCYASTSRACSLAAVASLVIGLAEMVNEEEGS